jgi:putative transposase
MVDHRTELLKCIFYIGHAGGMSLRMRVRKNIRLRDFDYSSANAYFITICTKNFCCYFGEIRNGIMGYSEIGNVASCYLEAIPRIRSNVDLDEFIVMPNHVHFIFEIKGESFSLENRNRYSKPIAGSLSVIVNQYKGAVKKWCNENGFNNFEWQGRFYDHVIRDNEEYWAIKNYIISNPSNWSKDFLRGDLTLANPKPGHAGGMSLQEL